jgi:tetratricopeptide (TPR) repeat protein
VNISIEISRAYFCCKELHPASTLGKMPSHKTLVLAVGILAAWGLANPTITLAEDGAAKALFDAGKYEDSIKELRANPNESPQYFYNLGTAYLKAGQSGVGLAYLAKANRLQPHDPDIQRNLKITQNSLSRLLGAERIDPASSPLEAMADRVSMGEIRGALGLLGLIVAALWLRAYLRSRNIKRTLLQPSGLIGLIGLGVTLGLYAAERLVEAYPPAYALEHVLVRSGPGSQFAQLGQLEAGVKVRQLSAQGGWEQIRYSQDGIGWVPASSLLLF